jgi:hypothetical protein
MAGLSEKERRIWEACAAEFSDKQRPGSPELLKADHQFRYHWRHHNPLVTEEGSEQLVADLRSGSVRPPRQDPPPRSRRQTYVSPPVLPDPDVIAAAARPRLDLPPASLSGKNVQVPHEVPRHIRRTRIMEFFRRQGMRRSLTVAAVGVVVMGILGAEVTHQQQEGFSADQETVLHSSAYLGRLGLCRDVLVRAGDAASNRNDTVRANELYAAGNIVAPDAPCALPPDGDGTVRFISRPNDPHSIVVVRGSDLVGPLAPTVHAVPTSPAPSYSAARISPSPQAS